MEKIQAKIEKGYNSYVSILFWVDLFLIIFIELIIRCKCDTLQCRAQKMQMDNEDWNISITSGHKTHSDLES